jgi:pimeloyl-ACP methyl ester carboxylesterase
MHVEKMGKETGSPLFLLHGWDQTHEKLRPLGELISSHSPTYLVDLPGFGKSGLPDGVWSSFDYADRLISYMDEYNISKADFLGHSFGGKIAMSLALRFPERVRRLVLLSPSGLLRQRSFLNRCRFQGIKWTGKALKLWDRTVGSRLFTTYFVPRFGSADYLKAGVLRPILVRSVNEDLSRQIPKIDKPTLILWGEKDSETPLDMAYRLHSLISDSSLLIFPHKGHQLFQEVGAHLCAYHIIPFLSKESIA